MTCMSQRARSPSVGVAHAPSVCCVWVGVALRGAIGGLKIRRARTFWFCLLDQPKGKAELRRYVTFVSSGVRGRDPVRCNGETSRRGCNSLWNASFAVTFQTGVLVTSSIPLSVTPRKEQDQR